jgi:hypothetical protein
VNYICNIFRCTCIMYIDMYFVCICCNIYAFVFLRFRVISFLDSKNLWSKRIFGSTGLGDNARSFSEQIGDVYRYNLVRKTRKKA